MATPIKAYRYVGGDNCVKAPAGLLNVKALQASLRGLSAVWDERVPLAESQGLQVFGVNRISTKLLVRYLIEAPEFSQNPIFFRVQYRAGFDLTPQCSASCQGAAARGQDVDLCECSCGGYGHSGMSPWWEELGSRTHITEQDADFFRWATLSIPHARGPRALTSVA